MMNSSTHYNNKLWDLNEKWNNYLESLCKNEVSIDCHKRLMENFWDEVMETLHNHPEEANTPDLSYEYPFEAFLSMEWEYRDEGRTLVKEELLIPPLRVCEKFIECCPEALFGLNSSEETALHQACYFSSSPLRSEIIKLVHKEYPKAAMKQNICGKLPIHVHLQKDLKKSWRQSLPILQYLVRQTPAQFIHLEDKGRDTPLLSLCSALHLSLPSPSHPEPIIEADRIEKWKFVADLITEAAKIKLKETSRSFKLEYSEAIQDDDPRYDIKLPEIHSVIYMRCLYCFLVPLIEIFINQLTQREPLFHNLTPLGMILLSYNFDPLFDNKEMADRDIFLNFVLRSEPRSARIRCTPDLIFPLHLSLINGYVRYYKDSIRHLVNAAPMVLSVRDPKNKLYPFLLAACAPIHFTDTSDKLEDKIAVAEHLETIYVLLREAPWVMGNLIALQK